VHLAHLTPPSHVPGRAMPCLQSCVRRQQRAQQHRVATYVCVRAATVRAGFGLGSARRGKLRPGERVEACEERRREADGRTRVRFSGGWVSVTAADGSVRLRQATEGAAAAAAAAAAPEPAPAVVGLLLPAPPAAAAAAPRVPAPPPLSGGPVGGVPTAAAIGTPSTVLLAAGGAAPQLMSLPLASAAAGAAALPDPFGMIMELPTTPTAPAPALPDPFLGLLGDGPAAPAPAPHLATTGGIDLLGFGSAAAAPPPGPALPAGWEERQSQVIAHFMIRTADGISGTAGESQAPLRF
jgi:hypothetical protein